MTDVMIDLETLAVSVDACIVQVGAVYFDRYTGERGDIYKANVDVASGVTSGAKLDPDTVLWWIGQSAESRASILAEPKIEFGQAMTELNLFLSKAHHIWSHATFDFVIVMQAFKRLKLKPLFSYKRARDIRTLMDLAGKNGSIKARHQGVPHDALDDCYHQIDYCVEAFKEFI